MKSAQLVYSILCDDVRLELGNKLSLMGVFENVYLPQFPAMLLRFAAVNHWIGAGDYETQVRVVSPDGREIAQSSQSAFRIAKPKGRWRQPIGCWPVVSVKPSPPLRLCS